MHGLKESTTLSTRLLLFNTRESRYLTLKKIISTCYYQQQQKTIRLLTRKREKGKLDKYDQKREESELFSSWRRSALLLFHHQPYPSLSICDSVFQVCVRSPLHSTPLQIPIPFFLFTEKNRISVIFSKISPILAFLNLHLQQLKH